MEHPDVRSEPEALFTIMKYNLLKNLGAGYTYSSLENETFEDIQLMTVCMNYEAKAMENAHNKAQFVESTMR